MSAELSSVVAVVRTWNNTRIRQQVGNLLSFLPHVIVLVNKPKDGETTKTLLSDLQGEARLDIIELDTGEYFWALPLNAGMDRINALNASRQKAGQSSFEFVFPCSVEANFEKEDVEKMIDCFADPEIGAVGTTFRGIQSGSEVPLTSYSYSHPRNTGMLIRLSVLKNSMVRNFDAICDSFGGMEDVDFVNRMLAFTEYRIKMLDLGVKLAIGVNWSQPEKEQREQEVIRNIAELRRTQAERWQEAWRQLGIPVDTL